jgi:hypothetical protein
VLPHLALLTAMAAVSYSIQLVVRSILANTLP